MKRFVGAACALSLGLNLLSAAEPASTNAPPPWSQIRSVKMSGGLRAFWNIDGSDSGFNDRSRAVDLEVRGKHTEIYQCRGGTARRL